MKHLILLLAFTMLIMVSCKKEFSGNIEETIYLKNVKSSLKDSLNAGDYADLDFTGVVKTHIDSGNVMLLRIPFKQKNIANDFVLLQTDDRGNCLKGRIVRINGTINKNHQYNGAIIIAGLRRNELIESNITNGYIDAFLPQAMQKSSLPEPYPVVPYYPWITLPEVIVVSSYSSGGISWSDWYSLLGFFNSGAGGGGGSGYYSGSGVEGAGGHGGGSGSGTGGGGTNGGGGTIVIDEVIEFEAEYIYGLPGVDITKMFKCFDNVPSAGANYKIKLCSDLPSNNNPGVSANFSAVSGGHTFLTITKTNGSSSVTQSFGFYPKRMPSFWDPISPVASEMKDNGVQEINASIEMNITESHFTIIKQKAITWSTKKYELADYNCSDYAIDIFNSIRSNPLTIPGYQIILPGSTNPWNPAGGSVTITINKSPQMLFLKLKEMKNGNSSEASNIRIDQSHNYRAPVSKGECN